MHTIRARSVEGKAIIPSGIGYQDEWSERCLRTSDWLFALVALPFLGWQPFALFFPSLGIGSNCSGGPCLAHTPASFGPAAPAHRLPNTVLVPH